MEISAALAADLRLLSDLLDRDDADLETLLRTLAADVRLAVDSCLGLSMNVVIEGKPIAFTVCDGRALSVNASVEVPLHLLCRVEEGSSLVFFAANAGAFVDLAADLAFTLGLAPQLLQLDQHLTLGEPTEGMSGLAEMAQIEQAVGILIDQGHTISGARSELHRRAVQAETSVRAVAVLLIASAISGRARAAE